MPYSPQVSHTSPKALKWLYVVHTRQLYAEFRTNRRLNQSLRAVLVDKNPKLWDSYIPYICSALNSTKNRMTGYTANFLRWGHELNTPVSLLLTNSDMKDVVGEKEVVTGDVLNAEVRGEANSLGDLSGEAEDNDD